LGVHSSGYYVWKAQPMSTRSTQDQRVSALILQCWEDSGRVYGYRKISSDLNEMGEQCGKHRVARLMRLAGLRSHTGYGRRPGGRGTRPY
jgi:putative transposase